MFLYRNFKQICPTGRMSSTQWRQIFRLIYKGATDYEFADRIFLAIAGNRSQKLITFEDLVFCLYDLIQSFRNAHHHPQQSENGCQLSIPSTTTALFTFSMMKPSEEGLVDEAGFLRYTKCIFDLNASIGTNTCSGDAATFGMIQHMGSSQGSSQHTNEKASAKLQREQMVPWVENLARQQFKALDSNDDGFIQLQDIQRMFDQQSTYEPLILHQDNEYNESGVLLEQKA